MKSAFNCVHRSERGYCDVIEHSIFSGFASEHHCKNCDYYEVK